MTDQQKTANESSDLGQLLSVRTQRDVLDIIRSLLPELSQEEKVELIKGLFTYYFQRDSQYWIKNEIERVFREVVHEKVIEKLSEWEPTIEDQLKQLMRTRTHYNQEWQIKKKRWDEFLREVQSKIDDLPR